MAPRGLAADSNTPLYQNQMNKCNKEWHIHIILA